MARIKPAYTPKFEKLGVVSKVLTAKFPELSETKVSINSRIPALTRIIKKNADPINKILNDLKNKNG